MQCVEGGCLCSVIRFRVTGAPLASIICHCNTCRKASSAPSVAWLTFDRSNFQLLSGKPSSFHSSPGVVRRFCGACGSALLYESDESPKAIDIATISLDAPSLFPPTREVWLEHKVPWEANNRSIGQYPKGSGDGPYAEVRNERTPS